jgi:ribosome maturation factor RimP
LNLYTKKASQPLAVARQEWALAHFFIVRDSDSVMTQAGDNFREQVLAIAERVAASEGMEVVDVECHSTGRRGRVAIFLDKPDGIKVKDCELVSRQVSAILDIEDLFPGSFVLEVSSPGLDRKLVKPSDYEKFLGRKVKVKLISPRDGRKQFTGRLSSFDGDTVTLELAPEVEEQFKLEEIRQARLVVEI